jgi:hypothetical protein
MVFGIGAVCSPARERSLLIGGQPGNVQYRA